MAHPKQDLVELILSHADRSGSPVAIEQGERSVSYAELRELIRDRASELTGRGASAGFVAIERRKSPEFLVDFLAVLAIGGTVIPLDPDTPPDRRDTFLRLVRPDFVLGEPGIARLGDGPEKLDLAQLPGGGGRRVPDEGAFVYFTSGSTGLPKPVLGSAAGVRYFVDWFGPEFGIGPGDRFAFIIGLSFEASLRDIFAPLAAGATVVLPTDDDTGSPEATVAWLARKRVTVVTVVPSVARTWLRQTGITCPTVRAVFFIGEPPAGDVLTSWHRMFPATAVRVNSYGSTESGQATIYRRVARDEPIAGRVPAGRPVPGTRFCLIPPESKLDAELVRQALEHPAPSGEVVLVSRACSLGYLGMPEENHARFADLGGGVTAYRTGDLGRVDDNDELVVVGRADDEVKINGVRVHPVEVTRAIRAQAGVADVFVTTTRNADTAYLTGYVVPAGSRPLNLADLRRHLIDVLPLAMIPARFVEVTELPRTRTGKIDRAALGTLAERLATTGDAAAPSGDTECWLAGQLAELLDIARVSATDDVFALGCDSIVAASLASRIQDRFGIRMSLRDIFAAATIRDIAANVLEYELLSADPAELQALLDAIESTDTVGAVDGDTTTMDRLRRGALSGFTGGERA